MRRKLGELFIAPAPLAAVMTAGNDPVGRTSKQAGPNKRQAFRWPRGLWLLVRPVRLDHEEFDLLAGSFKVECHAA